VALLEAAALEHEMADPPHVEQVRQQRPALGAWPNTLLAMRSALSASLPVRMPFSLSSKTQSASSSVPRSKRMPAPLPAGAGAAELDVADPEAAAPEHPDALAFRQRAVGQQHRPGTDAADFEILRPHRDVAPVGAGR
jgi:hypothetical protein